MPPRTRQLMARSRNPTINSKLVLEWDGLRIDKALSSRIRRGLPKALANQQPRPLGTSHVYDETQYRQWISLGSDIYLAGLFFSIEALMPDITSYEFMIFRRYLCKIAVVERIARLYGYEGGRTHFLGELACMAFSVSDVKDVVEAVTGMLRPVAQLTVTTYGGLRIPYSFIEFDAPEPGYWNWSVPTDYLPRMKSYHGTSHDACLSELKSRVQESFGVTRGAVPALPEPSPIDKLRRFHRNSDLTERFEARGDILINLFAWNLLMKNYRLTFPEMQRLQGELRSNAVLALVSPLLYLDPGQIYPPPDNLKEFGDAVEAAFGMYSMCGDHWDSLYTLYSGAFSQVVDIFLTVLFPSQDARIYESSYHSDYNHVPATKPHAYPYSGGHSKAISPRVNLGSVDPVSDSVTRISLRRYMPRGNERVTGAPPLSAMCTLRRRITDLWPTCPRYPGLDLSTSLEDLYLSDQITPPPLPFALLQRRRRSAEH